jgi:hypothetical protein
VNESSGDVPGAVELEPCRAKPEPDVIPHEPYGLHVRLLHGVLRLQPEQCSSSSTVPHLLCTARQGVLCCQTELSQQRQARHKHSMGKYGQLHSTCL